MKVLLYAVFKDLVAANFVASGLVNESKFTSPLGSSLDAALGDDIGMLPKRRRSQWIRQH
jgi:hypothetical protein